MKLKKFNESLDSERFFFDTDCSGHWYLVPVSLTDTWYELNTDDEDDYETIDKFITVFSEHMLSGGINGITFEKPGEHTKRP